MEMKNRCSEEKIIGFWRNPRRAFRWRSYAASMAWVAVRSVSGAASQV